MKIPKREWVESQANIGGVPTVGAVIEQRLADEIDQKLIEGLESGEPIEMDGDFWTKRRQKLENAG